MRSNAQIQADLDALDTAIAAGVTSVNYDGKSTNFRSLDEMLRIRNILAIQLGQVRGSSTILAAHDRGFCK